MKFKKLLKNISMLVLLISSFLVRINGVHAYATKGDIIQGKTIEGPYYITHIKGTRESYIKGQFLIRSSDGQFVYCVQPFVSVKEDNSYDVTTEDFLSVVTMSEDAWNKITRIAYYGYGYKDDNYDHTDEKYYMAAQMLIWRIADSSVDSYFTNYYQEKRNDNILANEMKEIEDLANRHLVIPKFSNVPEEMVVGETIEIVDTNNVLENYTMGDIHNATIDKSGNKLSITATSVGTLDFTLNKYANRYGEAVNLYYAVDSQNAIVRGDIDPIRLVNKIKVYGRNVTINKLDKDTNTSKPQGNASLSGAIYGVYKEDGTYITSLKTNSEGVATSDDILSLGRYYLIEEDASTGYLVDDTKYYFNITETEYNPVINVYEKVITRDFEFIKVYADSNTGIMIPEKGIEFGIYSSDNELVLSKITDEQGSIKFNLPYGKYTVKQLTKPNGYEKIKDFSFEVNSLGDTIKKVISNAEITARLKVIKIDKVTGEIIKRAGIKFQIVNAKTGELVKQKITYPTVKILDTFETNNNGILITPYPLGTGTYYLKEVDEAIDGYLWNDKSVEFTIDDNTTFIEDEISGIVFETFFDNEPVKGKVEITKLGEKYSFTDRGLEYYDSLLSGVKFGLYQNDKLLLTGITDKNGRLVFDNLDLGKYCIKELETNSYYVLSQDNNCFELKYKDQYTPIITQKLELKNNLKSSKVSFTKIDSVSGKPIANTYISIYSENDDLIYTGRTDENGKIVFESLPIGNYYYIETKAADGYVIDNEKITFKVTGEDEVKLIKKNKRITGTLEFSKVDFSTSEPLPNTKIEIYRAKTNEIVFEGLTDEEGMIVIHSLDYGRYYILEKEAPDGYNINEEKMYFEILEDGKIVKVTMTDDKILVEVPITNKDDYFIILGSITIGLSIGIIAYEKIKDKKKK